MRSLAVSFSAVSAKQEDVWKEKGSAQTGPFLRALQAAAQGAALVQSLFHGGGNFCEERGLGGTHRVPAGLQLCVFWFIPPCRWPQEWAAAHAGSEQQRLAKSRSSWSYSRGKHLTAVVSWTWSAGKRGKVLPGRRGENAVSVLSGSH